jgi:sortase A
MRRAARIAGMLMIAAGVATLAWTLVVWRWEDPFTGLVTRLEQHRLGDAYAERLREPAGARLASIGPGEVAGEARRYRRALERGEVLGRIRVPRIGLEAYVVNGTDSETLKKGPGRYIYSFMPGEGRLVYVAGHRTTYGAPFSRIDRLEPGDRVVVEVPYATFEYRVARHAIVEATATEVLRSRNREELALQACHPRFFATHRYLVYATPVRVTPRGGEPLEIAGGETAPQASSK